MFKYYLYFDDEPLEVQERFFYNLLLVYSTQYEIYKIDLNGIPSCEASIAIDEPLFFYLHTDVNKFKFFATVFKVS